MHCLYLSYLTCLHIHAIVPQWPTCIEFLANRLGEGGEGGLVEGWREGERRDGGGAVGGR